MLDRMDSGADGILHSRRSMGMGGDFSSGLLRFFHGGLEFLHGHLRLVRRGAWREDAARRNDFDDSGPGGITGAGLWRRAARV